MSYQEGRSEGRPSSWLVRLQSSPGWTRTNNPSVNSRMLCQLSYRGRKRPEVYPGRGRAVPEAGLDLAMDDAQAAHATISWPLRLVRWPMKLLRTLARVIPQAVDGYFADRCGQHAAGIAYRVLFSLVPLSIVLVAIFGLVLRNDSLRDDVIREIVDALPLSDSGSADVTREIEKLASPATGLGLSSLLVFAWAATGMMASLRAGLEVAMRVDRGRPAVRGKLVDVILIVGAAALVLGVVLLNLAQEVLFGPIGRSLDRLGLDGGLFEAGDSSRRAARGHHRGRPAPLPFRACAAAQARRCARRRDRDGDPVAGDLARLGHRLRANAEPEPDLRCSDIRSDLRLLGLSLRIGVSARCRDRRRMVTSVRTDRRTALAPDQAGRARALRLSGPSPTSSAGASSGSHRPACVTRLTRAR